MATSKEESKTEEKVEKIQTPGGKYTYANGKRKSAVARVRLYKGGGKIMINNKDISEFCNIKTMIGMIKEPLKLVGKQKDFDVTVFVTGGGHVAQGEATRHGIAKSLVVLDPLSKPVLKKAGLLTRDPRVKERKKFGLKRARKAPQFSKR